MAVSLPRYLLGKGVLALLPLGRFPTLNRMGFRLMGVDIGIGTKIYSDVRVFRSPQVSIGHATFIGSRTTFVGGRSRITIGNHCDISDEVRFVCGTHELETHGLRSAGRGISRDIVVGNGVWIGYGAIILPGIIIGDKAVIGARAVVSKDIPARTIAYGNPIALQKAF